MSLERSFHPYVLTSLDHVVPHTYLNYTLTFSCENPSSALPVLEGGLAELIAHLPFIAGNVSRTDLSEQLNGKKNVAVVHPPTGAFLEQYPMFRVRSHQRCIADEKATFDCPQIDYDTLADDGFIPSSDPIAETKEVMRFQANVLVDGVLLAVSFLQSVIDEKGAFHLAEALADCCRRVQHPDYHSLKTNWWLEDMARRQIRQATTTRDINVDHAYQNIPLHDTPPDTIVNSVSRRLSLSSTKIAQLEKLFKSLLPQVVGDEALQLSTDDIVTATVWLCTHRARIQSLPAQDREKAARRPLNLSMPVDIRRTLIPQLPTKYIGNATVVAQASHIVDAEQQHTLTNNLPVDKDDLSLILQLAVRLRRGHLGVDNDFVRAVITQQQKVNDWGSFLIKPSELMVRNIRDLPNLSLDFGPLLGKVQDFDLPDNRPFDGGCWILSAPEGDSEEPWKLRMTLEEHVMSRLQEDKLYRWISDEGMLQPKL